MIMVFYKPLMIEYFLNIQVYLIAQSARVN